MTETVTAAFDAKVVEGSSLYNKDLAPVAPERRTWRTYNYAALWISMSVNIPTYLLASGMIAGGMNWSQALFTVFLGNVLVLVPMLLNAHAGALYPTGFFPVAFVQNSIALFMSRSSSARSSMSGRLS